jgi:hypothetical protein
MSVWYFITCWVDGRAMFIWCFTPCGATEKASLSWLGVLLCAGLMEGR